jgi:pimeloyl-ACP methyl ester carboxylesterase
MPISEGQILMSSSSTRPPTPGARGSIPEAQPGITRRRFAGLAGFVGATVATGLAPAAAHADAAGQRGGKGRGRRCRPPRADLPAGFRATFRSRFIDANGLRQHAVIGGDGPPLLLVHGWPENWYAWRMAMPALARDFEVIAVDQRGIGKTDKPLDGYDSATLANDLAALMDALGHQRFAAVGHDVGHFISYALAADHPDRVDRVALLEVPGPPGALPSPPLFLPEPINNKIWHIPFNRVEGVPEQLITGREDIYFGYEFDIQAGKKLPRDVIDYYVRLVSDPDSLRGSLGFYRAWDATMAQNAQRGTRPLTMPVLAIGGAASWGQQVGDDMKKLATNVQSVVIPDAGHWLAEEAPDELLAALTPFLAPYRDASAATNASRPQGAAAAGSLG